MDRLLLALVIVAVAAAIALVARRRRAPDAPTQTAHEAPAQLDRRDFAPLVPAASIDAEWLVVVFTSVAYLTPNGSAPTPVPYRPAASSF